MTKPSLTIQLSLLGLLCLGLPVLSVAQIQVPRRSAKAEASKATRIADGSRAAAEQTIQFSFEDTEWKEVIPWFAEQAGFSLQPIDDWPEGTLYLVDKSEYSVIDGLDQLNHALRLRNPPYTLVRNRNMLVLAEANGNNFPSELIETVPEEKLNERGKYETMRCVFEFGELVSTEYDGDLSKLIEDESQSSIVVFAGANQIHVQATGAKLRVMRDLIMTARQRQNAENASVTVYRLKHTDADSFLFVARGLLGLSGQEKDNSREDNSLAISAEPLSDRLFVKGTTTGLKQFEEVAALLDVAPEAIEAGGPLDEPFGQSYAVTSDPKLAFDVLQTFLASRDSVQMQQDEITGAIVVRGRKADHQIVADTLAMLDGNSGEQFDVIPLQYADPARVLVTLQSLWGQTGTLEPTGPRFLPGAPSERTIIVRGTPSEVTLVKTMIAKLDGATTRVDDGPRTRTRVIPIDDDVKRDQVLDLLEDYWPSTGRTNGLNVVLPEERSSLRNRLRRLPERSEPAASGAGFDDGSGTRNNGSGLRNNGSGTRNNGSGSGTEGSSRREAPPFDFNGAGVDSRQRLNDGIDSAWRSAKVATFRLLARSSSLITCCVGSRFQFPGLPVALLAAPRQLSFSSEPAQDSGSGTSNRSSRPDYVPPQQFESIPGDDIQIKATEGGIVITSSDLDALDDMEDLILSQIGQQSEVQKPTFFYLRHRYADEIAGFLGNYFGISGGDDGGGGGGLVGGVLNNLGGGGTGDLLDSFLGGADGGGASSILEGDVRFDTDPHFNTVYVTGATETDLIQINDVIDLLDQPDSPQDPELLGRFFTIPVRHRDPEELKATIEVQLSDLIAPSGGGGEGGGNEQQANQQGQMARLLAQVAGGGGGGGNGGGGNAAASERPRAVLGVDMETSQLLVTGPEFIYKEVLKIVMELDKPQFSDPPILVVIPNGGRSSDFLKRNLKALFGSKIEISDEESEDEASSSSSSSNSSSSSSSDNSSQQAQQRQTLQRIRQQQQQQQGGGRGNGGGGGRGGGGGGRGNR